MSRPDSDCPIEIGVATPFFEVATWAILAGQKGGRDMEKGRCDVEDLGLSQFEVATSF